MAKNSADEKESEEAIANTKAWANFKETKPEKKEEVDTIETKSMNKEQKSQLLHEVAKSAE